MDFQKRDGRLLMAIYWYGGVLAFRHLHLMFWPGKTERAVWARLAKLVRQGYVTRPTARQRRTQPVPEPIYWLGWKGILWIAAQHGVVIDPPAKPSEYQMRRLAKRLRDAGIRWVREPSWLQLTHDLTVVDFHLAVEKAVSRVPMLRLEKWIHETEFRSDGDTITYLITGRDGKMKKRKKRVYPDGYFVIADEQRLAQGMLARARFLLELDHSSHANQKFGREKVTPGLAYIKSMEYKERFGANSGRWLVVTTGQVRMKNLMRQTLQVSGPGAGAFLFTTFAQLKADNVLTDSIWRQVESEEPVALIT